MSSDRTRAVVVLLGLLATTAIVWLGAENLQLKRIVRTGTSVPSVAADGLNAGDRLPDAVLDRVGANSGGEGRTATLPDIVRDGALVFFFTTRCPYCANSFPQVEALTHELEPIGVSVVGVALDGQHERYEAVAEATAGFTVLVPRDVRASASFQIRQVPTTVLVSGAGLVVAKWVGQLDAGRVAAIAIRAREEIDQGG